MYTLSFARLVLGRMARQLNFKVAKLQVLKDAWEAELKPYRLILGESNNNADNMLSTMPIVNENLVDKLLFEYMQRCSLKHALVFF